MICVELEPKCLINFTVDNDSIDNRSMVTIKFKIEMAYKYLRLLLLGHS